MTGAEDSELSKFLWQLALVGATALFGVLAEWARRMLPPPRERVKRHKLHLVKPPRTKATAPDTADDDSA